jgi:hypothetical protein
MSAATALWINIPLMVLAFGLMTGIPLWLVIRRHEWHHAPESRSVPAYKVRREVAHETPRGRRPSRVMVPSIQH